MVNELRTSITQQVIRKDTGDKLQAFAISMFFKGKSNQSSRIQVVFIKRPSMAEASQIAGFACCSDARKFVKENEYTFLAVRGKDGSLVRSRLA